jgi:glycosyltransferase involved in cell wall biosynthesis
VTMKVIMMKKICIIGQFPPPVHGLSKALETLLNSRIFNEKYELTHVDIKDNKKVAAHMSMINRQDTDIFYFTISQSKWGNLRDMLILANLFRKGKKVVIHYHGGYFRQLYSQFNPLQRAINKKLLAKVDVMIVLSKSLECLFAGIVDAGKIRICENCIEDSQLLTSWEYESKIFRLMETGKPLEVVYLSNFIKSKGYFDLLMAAERLKDRDLHFHFAGSFFNREDEEEFLAYIQQNGLQDKVSYHGVVTGERKKRLLERCDIFALPTYYPNEGQPISIIEAMGNGLAIISTKHAGIPDIVSEENGFLIEPQSPEAIAGVIAGLLQDRSGMKQMADENRSKILRRYKEADYLKRLELIMDEV